MSIKLVNKTIEPNPNNFLKDCLLNINCGFQWVKIQSKMLFDKPIVNVCITKLHTPNRQKATIIPMLQPIIADNIET